MDFIIYLINYDIFCPWVAFLSFVKTNPKLKKKGECSSLNSAAGVVIS